MLPDCVQLVFFRCQKDECIFDHSADSSTEEYPEESQYQGITFYQFTRHRFLSTNPVFNLILSHVGDFPEDSGSYSERFVSFSGRGDQIPGIGDGEMPVVPAAKPEDKTDTGQYINAVLSVNVKN